jgi:hypothetical protein
VDAIFIQADGRKSKDTENMLAEAANHYCRVDMYYSSLPCIKEKREEREWISWLDNQCRQRVFIGGRNGYWYALRPNEQHIG